MALSALSRDLRQHQTHERSLTICRRPGLGQFAVAHIRISVTMVQGPQLSPISRRCNSVTNVRASACCGSRSHCNSG